MSHARSEGSSGSGASRRGSVDPGYADVLGQAEAGSPPSGNGAGQTVVLDARGVSVAGRYRVLLCSSLFYFRVPEGLWSDRMAKVKEAGYNALDVYFPWCFHETQRDVWDLERGMRDVRAFLGLAARHGLYVVARPGPYICSEWDGGGLPAYLAAEGLPIRQNQLAYLRRVREWYGRILPIIAQHELGAGGSVILVQVENELDFFDCTDPRGYITALRDMAREMGIRVPLVACAGQGDLDGAWAGVEGVAPTLNLYLEPRQPGLERELCPYVRHLESLGYPLLVTETAREALLLRRLIAVGAKLVGSYNQVGGFDFGFSTAVNNWGLPLAFQTCHYDLGCLVDPFGVVREHAWEHRALGGLVRTLGEALAASRPCTDHGIAAEVDGTAADFPILALGPGPSQGYAVGVSNTDARTMRVRFRRGDLVYPLREPMVVEPGVSTFVFFDLPLQQWGMPGSVVFSTAEPYRLRGGRRPVLVFQTAVDGELHYDAGDGVQVVRLGARVRTRAILTPGSGRTVGLECLPRRDVVKVAGPAGRVVRQTRVGRQAARRPALRWSVSRADHDQLFPVWKRVPEGRALAMEHHGALRGYALYRAEIDAESIPGAHGVVLHDAADVVSVYLDGKYRGTQVPGGNHAYFDLASGLPGGTNPHELVVRCEIWGHSNFHDPRLPALRAEALRGISGATLVRDPEELPLWEIEKAGATGMGPYLSAPGGRLEGGTPITCRSSRTVAPDVESDHQLLWLKAAECPTQIYVDGRAVGRVDRYHPMLSLGRPGTEPGGTRLELESRKWYAAERTGRAYLLRGIRVRVWSMARMEEPELSRAALGAPAGVVATFPLRVPAGGLAWLVGRIPDGQTWPCSALVFGGRNIKATVVFNDHVVGRVFLDSPVRPPMAGGRDDLAYLPSCWFRPRGNRLAVLLEAVGGPGRLVSVRHEAVG